MKKAFKYRPLKADKEIEKRLELGHKPAKIAADLGIARSTVYRFKAKTGSSRDVSAAYNQVSTRLTDDETRALDAIAARKSGMTRSAALRLLVRHAGSFPAPTPEEEVFLKGIESDLARLGGNFNQIAQALSASMKKIGRADPTRDQINAMIDAEDEVALLKGQIRRMLENWQARTSEFIARLEDV